MLVVGVLLAAFVRQRNSALRQANRVAFLESNGAIVRYDYHQPPKTGPYRGTSSVPEFMLNALGRDFFHNAESVQIFGSQSSKSFFREAMADQGGWLTIRLDNHAFNSTDIELIGRQRGCTHLLFHSIAFETSDLEPLSNLRSLEVLEFGSSQLPDCDLGWLQKLPKLWHLQFSSQLNQHQLSQIARLNTLRSLSISDCDMRTAGCAWLEDLTALEDLTLNRCNLTDHVFVHLQKLSRLKNLNLMKNQIEGELPEGVALPPGVVNLQLSDNPLKTCKLIERSPKLQAVWASRTALTREVLISTDWPEDLLHIELRGIAVDDDVKAAIQSSRVHVDRDQ